MPAPIKRFWALAGHFSTAAWLWSLGGGLLLSVLTAIAHQPLWEVVWFGLGGAAIILIIYHRISLLFRPPPRPVHEFDIEKSERLGVHDEAHAEVVRHPKSIGDHLKDILARRKAEFIADSLAPPPLSALNTSESRFPERHKQILNSLADVLAEVQNLSLAKAYWNQQTHHALRQDHFSKLTDARTRAENLNEQIPYDPDTMHTVRDFLQAAHIVVHDGLQGWDDRESRSDLARIAAGLFRYLHDGNAVDRDRIDLPDWCRAGDPSAPLSDRFDQQRRREIIANGRDIVQQYCDHGMPVPFAEHLAKQRAYLDIKPHIGDQYWQQRFKRERPDTPEQRDLDQADFQAELARLEKEWGL